MNGDPYRSGVVVLVGLGASDTRNRQPNVSAQECRYSDRHLACAALGDQGAVGDAEEVLFDGELEATNPPLNQLGRRCPGRSWR